MTAGAIEVRGIGGADAVPVLSLGATPLANALLTAEQVGLPEPRYPLELAFSPSSALLHLTASVPPELLFSEYVYFSSFSEGMVRSAEAIAGRLVRDRELNARSLVVEVASNDGYLLQFYKRAGVQVLGVEPAENVARVAEASRGIPTRRAFFGAALGAELAAEGVRADVVHANNVLAHVPDLHGFADGLRALLKPSGVAVIEVPYVKEMLDHCEFDTIYHEHLYYFSLTALQRLFCAHGLEVADVERLPIHGGSLRVWVGRRGLATPSEATRRLLAAEAAWGVERPETYLGFAARVEALRTSLRELLDELKARGARVAAYGAAAKGSTLLNYCGVGRETLDYVADRSTVKQGLYMPGVHLPIVSPALLLEDRPDFVLLLAWNFAEEIMAQQAEYARRGGRFVVPVPAPRVV